MDIETSSTGSRQSDSRQSPNPKAGRCMCKGTEAGPWQAEKRSPWLESGLGPAGEVSRSRSYRPNRTSTPIWQQWDSIKDFKQREWQSQIAVLGWPVLRMNVWVKANRAYDLDTIATKQLRSDVGLVNPDESKKWLHLASILVLPQAHFCPRCSFHQKCPFHLASLLSSYSSFKTQWSSVLPSDHLTDP